jgi:hypothetical protein
VQIAERKRNGIGIGRKRLANCIYPALSIAAMMMPPSSTDMLRVHHEFELI